MSSEPHAKPWPFRAKMTADRAEHSSQKSLFTWQKSRNPVILNMMTKKLAEMNKKECNLWKFPKSKKQGIFPSCCHSPSFAWILAAGGKREQHSSRITVCDVTEASIMYYLHCKSLAVVFQKAKQGKKGLAAAELGHLRACCRDL